MDKIPLASLENKVIISETHCVSYANLSPYGNSASATDGRRFNIAQHFYLVSATHVICRSPY